MRAAVGVSFAIALLGYLAACLPESARPFGGPDAGGNGGNGSSGKGGSGSGYMPCYTDQDCKPGHGCVVASTQPPVVAESDDGATLPTEGNERASRGVCTGDCKQAICDARGLREQCSSRLGTCTPIHGDCSSAVPCINAQDDFCDPTATICYPKTGECGSHRCPKGAFCADVCRIPRVDRTLTALSTKAEIAVPAMVRDGVVFTSTSQIRFDWKRVSAPTYVVVLTEPRSGWSDADLDELSAGVIWSSAPEVGAHSTTWSAGESFMDKWIAPPIAPPMHTTLYYVVLAGDGGELTGASAAVPFRVGSPWPDVGSACGVDAAQCGNPSKPLVCRSNVCELECASNLECTENGLVECGDPVDGKRVCVRE